MLNVKNKNLPYKISILLFALFNISTAFSQKVDPSDPTYFRADHRNMADYIKWKGEEYRDIAFSDDSISTTDGMPLEVKKKGYENMAKNNFTPFILDTVHYNSSGYFHFSAHPDYFTWLNRVDATRNQISTKVGQLKMDMKVNKKSVTELFHLLIQFNVISTYFHLYAELVIKKTTETADHIEVQYNCLYHFCTSDCFDPKYSFSLRFDKKTKEIILIK